MSYKSNFTYHKQDLEELIIDSEQIIQSSQIENKDKVTFLINQQLTKLNNKNYQIDNNNPISQNIQRSIN